MRCRSSSRQTSIRDHRPIRNHPTVTTTTITLHTDTVTHTDTLIPDTDFTPTTALRSSASDSASAVGWATLRITALNTTEGTLMEDSHTDQPYTGLHPMEADSVDTAEAALWVAAVATWAEAALWVAAVATWAKAAIWVAAVTWAAVATWAEAATDKFRADLEVC